jgi:hypothetical protein
MQNARAVPSTSPLARTPSWTRGRPRGEAHAVDEPPPPPLPVAVEPPVPVALAPPDPGPDEVVVEPLASAVVVPWPAAPVAPGAPPQPPSAHSP